MDRLLSKRDLTNIGKLGLPDSSDWQQLILKAQDAKTATALIKQIEKQRDEVCCVGQEITLCRLADPCCSFMKKSCTWWQEIKESVK